MVAVFAAAPAASSQVRKNAPWDDLPADPEERLRELRQRLKEWRRVMPCDYSDVTTALQDMIREVLRQHPELRQRRQQREKTRLSLGAT